MPKQSEKKQKHSEQILTKGVEFHTYESFNLCQFWFSFPVLRTAKGHANKSVNPFTIQLIIDPKSIICHNPLWCGKPDHMPSVEDDAFCHCHLFLAFLDCIYHSACPLVMLLLHAIAMQRSTKQCKYTTSQLASMTQVPRKMLGKYNAGSTPNYTF